MRKVGGAAALAVFLYAVFWSFGSVDTSSIGFARTEGQNVLVPVGGVAIGQVKVAPEIRIHTLGSPKGHHKPRRPRPISVPTTTPRPTETTLTPTTSTPTPTTSAPSTTLAPTTTSSVPAPSTTQAPSPTTTVAPTTTVPSGAPAGAIVLDPSKNVGSIVASSPNGATFYFTAGTYRRVTVNPKEGQVFIAAPGVVFDGENATKAAFVSATDPAPNDVLIRGFEIKNYTPVEKYGWNEGAIMSAWYGGQGGGTGWIVENVNVHHNRGAGIMLTDQGVIRNSSVHHNYAMGVKLYWAPNGGLVEGNEIYANNFDSANDFNETGGTKFAWTNGLVVKNNVVYDNGGPGLWTDIDNYNTVYSGNQTDGNAGPGIVHEISHSVTISGNVVTGNGFGAQGAPGDSWMWGAGILIANSDNATISGNTVSGNKSGIGIIQQNRGNYQAVGISVTNNSVTGPGWTGAVQDIGNPSFFIGKVTFSGNTYSNTTFVFGGSTITWDQWLGLGLQ